MKQQKQDKVVIKVTVTKTVKIEVIRTEGKRPLADAATPASGK